MAIKHYITLSTTEPNNEVGIIKIRQADEETQTLVVEITANGVPKSYEGLAVYFCAKLGQSTGLGVVEQKLKTNELTDPASGKLEYTLRQEDWQKVGRQRGYFSFRKMVNEHEFTEQFTTRDFTFIVTKSIYSDGVTEIKHDGSTYIWTIEDMLRLFKEYIATGQTDWESFVEQNREILGSIDPGGVILTELIDARGNFDSVTQRITAEENAREQLETQHQLLQTEVSDAHGTYSNLNERFNNQIGLNSDFRSFEIDKSFMQRVQNESIERGLNARWFGAKGDGVSDDTEALQAAIDYMLEKNEGRLILSGTYLISEPLVINRTNTNNFAMIRIEGQATIKKAANFIGNCLLRILIGYHDEDNISIENITFDGVDKTINGVDNMREGLDYREDGETTADYNQSKMIRFTNCIFVRCYRGMRLSSLSYAFYSCLYQNNEIGFFGNLAFNNNSFYNCQFRRNEIGCHIQSPNSTLGSVNNSFVGCNFESNKICGFINKRTNNTALVGCYFENNAFSYETAENSMKPALKCHIYIEGGSYGGDCSLISCFNWDNNLDISLYSYDNIVNSINQMNSRFKMSIHTGKIISDWGELTDFEFRGTSAASRLFLKGAEYSYNNSIPISTKNADFLINQVGAKRKYFKMVNFSSTTSMPLFKLFFKDNVDCGVLRVKLIVHGLNAAGNVTSEGFVDSKHFISTSKNASHDVINNTKMKQELCYANTVLDGGAQATNVLSETTEIVLTNGINRTLEYKLTNLLNQSAVGQGSATRLRCAIVVEFDGRIYNENNFTGDDYMSLE